MTAVTVANGVCAHAVAVARVTIQLSIRFRRQSSICWRAFWQPGGRAGEPSTPSVDMHFASCASRHIIANYRPRQIWAEWMVLPMFGAALLATDNFCDAIRCDWASAQCLTHPASLIASMRWRAGVCVCVLVRARVQIENIIAPITIDCCQRARPKWSLRIGEWWNQPRIRLQRIIKRKRMVLWIGYHCIELRGLRDGGWPIRDSISGPAHDGNEALANMQDPHTNFDDRHWYFRRLKLNRRNINICNTNANWLLNWRRKTQTPQTREMIIQVSVSANAGTCKPTTANSNK